MTFGYVTGNESVTKNESQLGRIGMSTCGSWTQKSESNEMKDRKTVLISRINIRKLNGSCLKERRRSHDLQKRYKERISAWTDRHVDMSILDANVRVQWNERPKNGADIQDKHPESERFLSKRTPKESWPSEALQGVISWSICNRLTRARQKSLRTLDSETAAKDNMKSKLSGAHNTKHKRDLARPLKASMVFDSVTAA